MTIAERLRTLAHPMSENMPDGERLTAFVHLAVEAADEIERLSAALNMEKALLECPGLTDEEKRIALSAIGDR